MPWVCTCGQRNIVNGLACLACDRLPDDSVEMVEAAPVRPGFRFREDPPAPVENDVTDEVTEPAAPARRFRFTISEPEEIPETQTRDTAAQDAPTSVANTQPKFRFREDPALLDVPEEEEASAPAFAPEPVQEVAEPVVVEEPVIDEPVVDETIVEEEPVVVQTPVVEEPVWEEPQLDTPVLDEVPSIDELPVAEDELDVFAWNEPVVEQSVVEDVPQGESAWDVPVQEPAGDNSLVDNSVVDDEEDLDVPAWARAVDETPAALQEPSWPEVDRRHDDRRATDRRSYDAGVEPGGLDDRLGGYVAQPHDEQPVDDADEWSSMRDILDAGFPQPAPAPVDETPAAPVDEDDPWEAFRLARLQYDADIAAQKAAPAQEEQLPVPQADDLAWAPEEEVEEPQWEQPQYAQPVEEFQVDPFQVDPFEVEPLDDSDPILDEVMAHNENALTEEDFAAFPTPWGVEPVAEEASQPAAEPQSFEHDWAQWGEEQAAGVQNAVPQQPVADDNVWGNDDVWSADAIADAHADWSTVPEEWTTENTSWNVSGEDEQPQQPQSFPQDEVVSWDEDADPWTSAGAEPWGAVATEDEWPVVSQPQGQEEWDGVTPQQPTDADAAWDETTFDQQPFDPQPQPEWTGYDDQGQDQEWPVVQQPLPDDAWTGEESDPWNVQQPSDQTEWDAQAESDDPWNVPGIPAADDPWNVPVAAGVDDPWNAAATYDDGADAFSAQPAADDVDGEQPWWTEQSGFGGEFAEQTEANLPYFDELDAEDSEDPYAYEEPAYSGVSDLFDADADLDEPDPFELPEDDWSLPDEPARSARSRQDREPAKNRGAKNGPKKNARPGNNKNGAKKKKPASKGKSAKATAGGFRLPFGSGSTAITVVVIAIMIIALSLLFKDAFQRVGAAPNPDGSQAPAATCADSPSNDATKIDLGAAMISSVDKGTVVADHQAGTGAIDFSRALAAEPDASTALSGLDQSRFERGYDRSFTMPKGGNLHVAVYEFKGSLCSAEYLNLHPADPAHSFTASDIANSSGEVTQAGAKSFNASIRGPIGNMVVIAQFSGAQTADSAKATLQSVLSVQVTNLRNAGVQ